MITLHLDHQLDKKVEQFAEQMQLSKSEFVRQSIFAFIEQQERPSAWELGKELFGKYASGEGNLSVDRKKLIKGKI